MQPFATPSTSTWLAAAATAAREAGIPVGLVVGPFNAKKAVAARRKAWRAILESNTNYSIIGLARTCGWHHSSIIYGLRPRTPESIEKRKIQNRIRYMRRIISDEVMRQNAALGMTAEAFAEAVGKPLSLILERASQAGIVMKREHFVIGRNVVKASRPFPCATCPAQDAGFYNPFSLSERK